MNNTIKPTISAVYSAGGIPTYMIGEVLAEVMGDTTWESSTVSLLGDARGDVSLEIVEHEPIDADHLGEVLNCLYDHVNNTKPTEWLEPYKDVLVDTYNELYVSVSKGLYYGPNCVVQVYYATI